MPKPMDPPRGTTWPAVIAKVRKLHQLNEAELAARIHASVPTISRWINGHTQPSSAHGHALLALLA